MHIRELANQLWKTHRGILLTLVALLVANVLLLVTLEQLVVSRVMEQESLFLKRQAEVRQLLRNRGGAATSPLQLFVLANQDLSSFNQAVPDYQEFTGLIEELLVLSGQARLDINQISYSSAQLKDSSLLKFNLSFNVVGSYEQVKKFIHSLEQSVRLITIQQISLQSVEGDDVNLRLNLETFFRAGSRES